MGAWSAALSLGLGMVAWTAPHLSENPPAPVVTCTVARANETRPRVYVLSRTAESGRPVWTLTMRGGPVSDREVRLRLPGARPDFHESGAQLRYRNGNGGRQIDLRTTPAHLDVWVDYGLDVNIEPDLDPRVDLMNTEGPAPAACTVGVS